MTPFGNLLEKKIEAGGFSNLLENKKGDAAEGLGNVVGKRGGNIVGKKGSSAALGKPSLGAFRKGGANAVKDQLEKDQPGMVEGISSLRSWMVKSQTMIRPNQQIKKKNVTLRDKVIIIHLYKYLF